MMERANVIDTGLEFVRDLETRYKTDMIVIHHTGRNDIDASAQQIHGWHINQQGWAGIGYHYVIRKNGTIEQGRPHWTVGAHAYGENSHTIGIHLSGDFMEAKPTCDQIESVAMLLANLCTDYGLPIDRGHIVGHRDLMATSCPGDNLYNMLDLIIGKAIYYAVQ
ncbi:peptidoglycan recognition family protein [Selenomonas sp. AB3002]|uniref:peptidoglycan recognition protein family protein n=1 Tax=Selenomonas sp. AB3002 TaxID=1392502 RepID=UPI000B28203F